MVQENLAAYPSSHDWTWFLLQKPLYHTNWSIWNKGLSTKDWSLNWTFEASQTILQAESRDLQNLLCTTRHRRSRWAEKCAAKAQSLPSYLLEQLDEERSPRYLISRVGACKVSKNFISLYPKSELADTSQGTRDFVVNCFTSYHFCGIGLDLKCSNFPLEQKICRVNSFWGYSKDLFRWAWHRLKSFIWIMKNNVWKMYRV